MHDVDIQIAIGKNRFEKQWKNKTMRWSSFLDMLSETCRTRETINEYLNLTKKQQDDIKDIGGFVGGTLKDGRRTDTNVLSRSLITLDADYAPVDLWDELELLFGYTCCMYNTHKHRKETPRYRLIIPLSRPVNSEEYEAIARKLAEDIGIDYFDDTTYQASRLMYWPSTSKDGEYVFRHMAGTVLDPQTVLDRYDDWHDISFWPMSSRVSEIRKKIAKKQGDPREKDGLIGAFCRTYDIHSVIETFLPDVYTRCRNENRYTFIHGTTAGGLVTYDDCFAYSNHATDPCSMKLCNAFDLVRIHKFSDKDVDVDASVPINKRPSWVAMMDFIREDKNTQATIVEELWQEKNDTNEPMPKEDISWRVEKLIRHSKTNQILSNIQNVVTILENDKALKGAFAYDMFGQRPIALRDLPWRKIADSTSEIKDRDDASFRLYLEKEYGISGKGVVEDAITHVTYSNNFHPIRDYLESCKWDRTSRIDTLLIDYLGAEDTPYVRAVTRKTLCAAVARVYVPGIKFDTMLTLIGGQGMGKTTFFERLGGRWFSNSMPTFKGKEAMESLQGVWILEVGELAAMKKAESEEVKNLLSKTRDNFRVAYGRRGEVFPRQCIIVGTTNKKEIFRDTTGNRRFWPVDCKKNEYKKKKFFKEFNQELVNQIWAEAKFLWEQGEELYLSSDIENDAFKIQEDHKEVDIRTEPIVKYLDTLLPEDWEKMELEDRREYLDTNYRGLIGVKKRDRVCVMEIVKEVFGYNTNNLDNYKAKEFNDILHSLDGWEYRASMRPYAPYKRGRGFVRVK